MGSGSGARRGLRRSQAQEKESESRANYAEFRQYLDELIAAGLEGYYVYFRDGQVLDKDLDLMIMIRRNSRDPMFRGLEVWKVCHPLENLHLGARRRHETVTGT